MQAYTVSAETRQEGAIGIFTWEYLGLLVAESKDEAVTKALDLIRKAGKEPRFMHVDLLEAPND